MCVFTNFVHTCLDFCFNSSNSGRSTSNPDPVSMTLFNSSTSSTFLDNNFLAAVWNFSTCSKSWMTVSLPDTLWRKKKQNYLKLGTHTWYTIQNGPLNSKKSGLKKLENWNESIWRNFFRVKSKILMEETIFNIYVLQKLNN